MQGAYFVISEKQIIIIIIEEKIYIKSCLEIKSFMQLNEKA